MALQRSRDAFELCADKALAGRFGKLKEWQKAGYATGLKRHRLTRLFVTCYGPQEGSQGRYTASGLPVGLRVCAADSLPMYSFVWLPRPAQLRQVLDRGSRRNDRIARGHGAECWVDCWLPRPHWRGMDTCTTDAYVIGGRP